MSKPNLTVVSNTQKETISIEQIDSINEKFDYIKVDLDLTKKNLVFNYKNGHRFYASLGGRARELTRGVEQYANWDVYVELKDPDNRNKGDVIAKLRRPLVAGRQNKKSKGEVLPFTAVKVHYDLSRVEVWVGKQHYEIPLRDVDPNTKHGKSFQYTGYASVREDVVATAQSLQDFLDSI